MLKDITSSTYIHSQASMMAIRSQSALLEKPAGRVCQAQSKPQSIVRGRPSRAVNSALGALNPSSWTAGEVAAQEMTMAGSCGKLVTNAGPAHDPGAWTREPSREKSPVISAAVPGTERWRRRAGQQAMLATCHTWIRFQTRQNGHVLLSRSLCAGTLCRQGQTSSRKSGIILSTCEGRPGYNLTTCFH
jgi:hypothetical protein